MMSRRNGMSGKSKNTVIIVYFVLVVFYAVIFLAVPFEKNTTTWVAFAFGCISIIVGAIVSYISFDKGQNLKSKVYGLPMFRLGYYYTIVQLILNIALFIAEFFMDIPAWISVVFGMALLGAMVIGVVSIDNTRELIEKQEINDSIKAKNMEGFVTNLNSLVRKCSDDKTRKALEMLAEKFRFSDPVSGENTYMIEMEIRNKISELADALSKNSNSDQIISSINDLLTERNLLCKSGK